MFPLVSISIMAVIVRVAGAAAAAGHREPPMVAAGRSLIERR